MIMMMKAQELYSKIKNEKIMNFFQTKTYAFIGPSGTGKSYRAQKKRCKR